MTERAHVLAALTPYSSVERISAAIKRRTILASVRSQATIAQMSTFVLRADQSDRVRIGCMGVGLVACPLPLSQH